MAVFDSTTLGCSVSFRSCSLCCDSFVFGVFRFVSFRFYLCVDVPVRFVSVRFVSFRFGLVPLPLAVGKAKERNAPSRTTRRHLLTPTGRKIGKFWGKFLHFNFVNPSPHFYSIVEQFAFILSIRHRNQLMPVRSHNG